MQRVENELQKAAAEESIRRFQVDLDKYEKWESSAFNTYRKESIQSAIEELKEEIAKYEKRKARLQR